MTPLLLAMLALGLASGMHCIGMCGGIVGAFSAVPLLPKSELLRMQVAFNVGRISSYAFAGALAGSLGAGVYAAAALPAQTALYGVASLALLLLGIHLAFLRGPLAALEKIGLPLWRRVQPLAARLLPPRSLAQAYGAGLVWGLLPCGLVYAALSAALVAGSPAHGAAGMLAFGLGTLPWLLAAGLAAARLRAWASRPAVRGACGALLIGYGTWGLLHLHA
jgi:sulfite exporter TauE/SafE